MVSNSCLIVDLVLKCSDKATHESKAWLLYSFWFKTFQIPSWKGFWSICTLLKGFNWRFGQWYAGFWIWQDRLQVLYCLWTEVELKLIEGFSSEVFRNFGWGCFHIFRANMPENFKLFMDNFDDIHIQYIVFELCCVGGPELAYCKGQLYRWLETVSFDNAVPEEDNWFGMGWSSSKMDEIPGGERKIGRYVDADSFIALIIRPFN